MSNHPLFSELDPLSQTATVLGETLTQGIEITVNEIKYFYQSTPTLYTVRKRKVWLAAPVVEPELGYIIVSKKGDGDIYAYFCSNDQFPSRGHCTELHPSVEGIYAIPDGSPGLANRKIVQNASVDLLRLFLVVRDRFYVNEHYLGLLFTYHRYDDIRELHTDVLKGVKLWQYQYLELVVENIPREQYIERMKLLLDLYPEDTIWALREIGDKFRQVLLILSYQSIPNPSYLQQFENLEAILRALLNVNAESPFWHVPIEEWCDLLGMVPEVQGGLTKSALHY